MQTRGFTLLELLVVLVILGFAAAVVPMAWRVPNASAAAATWPEVVTTARRLALGRSQSVELRTDGAGRWAIVTSSVGDTLRVGRLPEGVHHPADQVIRVDALGVCRPRRGVEGEPPFDMAACRETTSGRADGVVGATS